MKREDIEKAVTAHAIFNNTISPETRPYFRAGFINGAKWRISSVWHKTDEKPYTGGHIVIQFKNGNFTSWFVTSDIMEDFQQFNVKIWVYSKDLLPENNENK